MAFEIGEVVSPAVAAALIRRGESAGSGGFIRRDPTVRQHQNDGVSAADAMAVARENRLAELQAAQLEAAQRGEAFARERFEHGKQQADADREAGIKRGEAANKAAAAKAAQAARKRVSEIVGKIHKIMADAQKVDPNTGQVNPDALAQAKRAAAGLMHEIENSGLAPEEIAAIKARILGGAADPDGGGVQRGGDTTPAPRAPGNNAGQPPASSGQGQSIDGMTPEQVQQGGQLWGQVVRGFYSIHPQRNPSPEQLQAFRAQANGIMQQLLALPMSPARKRRFVAQYNRMLEGRGLPPINPPGIQRDSPTVGATGGSKGVEPGLARELTRPDRTP